MSAKYANLLNDETFKVVICARGNEGRVAGMLNILLPEKKIKQLKFLDREQHGLAISDKNVTFDLYCTEENGERKAERKLPGISKRWACPRNRLSRLRA